MANHFEGPNPLADREFRTVDYQTLLHETHPARFIDAFVSGVDISHFLIRYNVGPGKKGRAPKDVRLMLKVLLYAIFSRIYSARKIDYATEHYADFWLFTFGQRISHDKISDFINVHEGDIHSIFLETIYLAHTNSLLDFSALYQDGFFLKAKASKKKNYTKHSLKIKKEHLSKRLSDILQQYADKNPTEEEKLEKKQLENKLTKLGTLQKQLQEKINARIKNKNASKAAVKEKNTIINSTDPDADLMSQKDGSFATSYSKITATDGKADIIVASNVDGVFDEPHKALPLFQEANENCSKIEGSYSEVCADANFTSATTCRAFEENGAVLTGPTRNYENKKRNPEKYTNAIQVSFDEHNHRVRCSEGALLYEESRYFDKHKQTTIMEFSNKTACKNCTRLYECTKNKKGYRKVKIDINKPAQERTLKRYQSAKGQKLYKKRTHSAETFQGDLKHNGSFSQFLRIGLNKVRCDSCLHDIVWNLRRIFNVTGPQIVWNN